MQHTSITHNERLATPDERAAPDEALLRRDVAACYRLIHRYGMSDLSDGFVSARLASSPQEVVVGGYGMFPEEALPNILHRRQLGKAPPLEKHDGVDVDALIFSTAVFEAREDLNALIHAHSRFAMAFSALDAELLPISQWGHMFHGKIGVVPFDEDVSGGSSCGMIGWHLRNGMQAIILRNHGLIVPGRTVADAFFRLHRLEQACRTQVEAMQTGAPLFRPDATASRFWGDQYWSGHDTVDNDGSREWPGFLRMLSRDFPEFG